jgi:hypothetical protein
MVSAYVKKYFLETGDDKRKSIIAFYKLNSSRITVGISEFNDQRIKNRLYLLL